MNGSGDYLNGWVADTTGTLDQTKTQPIQIGQSGYSPQPTSKATLAANLPASPSGTAAINTQIPDHRRARPVADVEPGLDASRDADQHVVGRDHAR